MPGVVFRDGMGATVPGVDTGDMEAMLVNSEILEDCIAETGFGAANWVLADTLVVADGGGTIPESDVAAVVVDGAGVAEIKSSKSSSSPTIEA